MSGRVSVRQAPPATQLADLAAEVRFVRLQLSAMRSERLIRLLDYLLECTLQGFSPSEEEVARAALSSGEAFDPRLKGSTRVYVHRLRRKLGAIYRDRPGPRLQIPRGRYCLLLADHHETASPRRGSWRLVRFARWRTAGVLLAVVAAAGSSHLLRGQHPATSELTGTLLWQPLAHSTRPTAIVFGDHYLFADLSGSVAGPARPPRLTLDPAITSRDHLDLFLMQHPQHIGRWQNTNLNYAPSETVLALRAVLAAMPSLWSDGRAPPDVLPASRLTPAILKSSNVIYVGLLSGLPPLVRNPLFLASGFRIGTSYGELIDRDGRRYATDDEGAGDVTVPQRGFGYVARLPGPSANHLVIIAGTDGQSLLRMAEAAVAPVPAVPARAPTASPSRAFEALYRIESAGDVRLGQRRLVERSLDPTGVWDTSGVSQRFPDDIALR